MKCIKCSSYAINHHLHGRDGTDPDLCDVCFWRKRAQQPAQPEWVPVTQELLNNQHPWLYEQLWIAMKDGTVLQGIYEWRKGRYPDRFLTDVGFEWALDAAYVMPIVKPEPPSEQP